MIVLLWIKYKRTEQILARFYKGNELSKENIKEMAYGMVNLINKKSNLL